MMGLGFLRTHHAKSKATMLGLAALVLSACVDAQPAKPIATPVAAPSSNGKTVRHGPFIAVNLPEPAMQAILDYTIAKNLSSRCYFGLGYKSMEESRTNAALLKQYPELAGYSQKAIRTFIGSMAFEARVTTYLKDYIKRRGIIAGDQSTFCNAGRSEIAEKSAVGRYLYSF